MSEYLITELTPEQEAIRQVALILATLPITDGSWQRFSMYVMRGGDGAIWIDEPRLEEL